MEQRLFTAHSLEEIGSLPGEQVQKAQFPLAYLVGGFEMSRDHAQHSPLTADQRRGLDGAHARVQEHAQRGGALEHLARDDIGYQDAADAL